MSNKLSLQYLLSPINIRVDIIKSLPSTNKLINFRIFIPIILYCSSIIARVWWTINDKINMKQNNTFDTVKLKIRVVVVKLQLYTRHLFKSACEITTYNTAGAIDCGFKTFMKVSIHLPSPIRPWMLRLKYAIFYYYYFGKCFRGHLIITCMKKIYYGAAVFLVSKKVIYSDSAFETKLFLREKKMS